MAEILSLEEKEKLRHQMLPLSANPDFDNFGTPLINPYYDISADMKGTKCEIYGTEALDQAIENLICTEPGERLFNPSFFSPLYKVLFENGTAVNSIAKDVYAQIEAFIPVKIDTANAEIKFDKYSNELSLNIPYVYDFHGEMRKHMFTRVIGR